MLMSEKRGAQPLQQTDTDVDTGTYMHIRNLLFAGSQCILSLKVVKVYFRGHCVGDGVRRRSPAWYIGLGLSEI